MDFVLGFQKHFLLAAFAGTDGLVDQAGSLQLSRADFPLSDLLAVGHTDDKTGSQTHKQTNDDTNNDLYYIVEIIDPDTLQPIPEGEVGELVLTTINREGMPLLRYRTRDLTRILPGECPCGRHHKRLDRMKGRSDDMIILKGVNIFPIQIETVLMQFKELSSNYLITLETKDSNDEMMIEVELEKLFTDDYGRLQVLTKNITRVLKDEILVTPYVKLVPKGTLPQSEGKAVRVKDLRKPF